MSAFIYHLFQHLPAPQSRLSELNLPLYLCIISTVSRNRGCRRAQLGNSSRRSTKGISYPAIYYHLNGCLLSNLALADPYCVKRFAFWKMKGLSIHGVVEVPLSPM